MVVSKKDQIRALLKSIETGDPGPVAVVNEETYIQHNPQTHEGSEGLAHLFKRLSLTSPKVNIVRAFEDGDFVFAHTEYDFAKRNIGFEVFRFKEGRAVEHWDNIQRRQGPNKSSRSMVDGVIESENAALTEVNRAFVRSFVETVLIGGETGRLTDYFHIEQYTEHNPNMDDDLFMLQSQLKAEHGSHKSIDYRHVHRVLAEGSFVLSVSEGYRGPVHTSFYDLFRIGNGKIIEHWDTTETIAPRNEWKNDNGKF